MKRNDSLNNIWEILKPLMIYYLLYNAVFILLLSICRAIAGGLGSGYQAYLAENAETVTGLVSGLSMVIGVLPLVPMLRGELREHKLFSESIMEERGAVRRSGGNSAASHRQLSGDHFIKAGGTDSAGYGTGRGLTAGQVLLTIVLAASASLSLNIFLSLTGLVQTSASYRDVAAQQYGVLFGAGMVLFGLISPVTEEIVFRGLVFNRMRRYYPHAAAILVSGALFGVYHGNPVQGVYGGCMGVLMAYLYERMHSFLIPCLFHAAANLTVYTIAQSAALHGRLFTAAGCAALFVVAAGCVVIVEKILGRFV